MSPLAILVAVETVVLAGLAVLVTGLLRSHALILRRLHEIGAGIADLDEPDRPPPLDLVAGAGDDPFRTRPEVPRPSEGMPGRAAHDIVGTTLDGDAAAIALTGVRHRSVVAFLSSTCSTCERFWRAFADPEGLGLGPDVRLVVVVKDADEESPSRLAALAGPDLTVVHSSAAWLDHAVPGSPYVLFVDGPEGTVLGEGTGLDWPQVANLLGQATGDAAFAAHRRLAGQRGGRRSKAAADADRERRIDQELLRSGIAPGDQRLYGPVVPGDEP